MKGDVEGANRVLHLTPSSTLIDQTATVMARAELAYLDCDNQNALETFERHSSLMIGTVPQDVRSTFDANRSIVRLATRDVSAVREFADASDTLRMLRLGQHADSRSLVRAHEAARREDHREAVSLLWRELLRAYESGLWTTARAAHAQFSTECRALAWFAQAAFHAVAGLDKEGADSLASLLGQSRNLPLVAPTVAHLLSCAHLLEHRAISGRIINGVVDFVPDEQFDLIISWAIEGAKRQPSDLHAAEVISTLWDTLLHLIFRMSSPRAEQVAELAISHSILNKFILQRQKIVRVLTALVPKLSQPTLERLTLVVIQLLGPAKHDVDFETSCSLAAAIARHSSAPLREALANRLMPSGTALSDSRVAALAPIFGREPSSHSVEAMVTQAVRRLGKQVQKLRAGEEPDYHLSYLMMASTEGTDGRLVVFLMGGLMELDQVVSAKNSLSAEHLRLISDQIIAMIESQENLPSNKIALAQSLIQLADSLDFATSSLIIGRLERLMQASMTSSVWDQLGDTPLSNFRMDLGDATDVRASLLVCLATIGSRFPEELQGRVIGVVQEALFDSDQRIRKGGVIAISRFSKVSKSVVNVLISMTRDASQQVGEAALLYFANQETGEFDETQWDLLTASVRSGLQSEATEVRGAAAACIRRLQQSATSARQLQVLTQLLAIAEQDFSYYVRRRLRGSSAN